MRKTSKSNKKQHVLRKLNHIAEHLTEILFNYLSPVTRMCVYVYVFIHTPLSL